MLLSFIYSVMENAHAALKMKERYLAENKTICVKYLFESALNDSIDAEESILQFCKQQIIE